MMQDLYLDSSLILVLNLALFSPMSCMPLVVFAMPQLWQDYVKNMA